MLLLIAALLAAQMPSAQLVENTIRATLKDPDSAKFAWPNGFVQGRWRNLYGQKFTGSITCGTMNAKNGYGGYVGPTAVAAIIGTDGRITIENDDDYSDTINHGYVADQCQRLGLPTR